ncbi:hypothetical protein C343_03865 [Cryptococcus neoformans C23]|uniref:Extracellular membrane protein CFEM domain-containing protein n=1 Tax=Cryptococcus neoformans (strain H99 / ATCC 208821 / CBS 10515 / FGSC 9487) TaxID=235443 RepID=J9VT11_CRYN9|nr:hypothetical protein CNAG_02060 [Cryptococcus neoformans var. grubii H99]AFR95759.1 hypothetical protein CNAG_02060 [Cryptococcus neoformans var. grubii H99]AUB25599.1 hypothetical protein CKF44_02060 [Cryptococcus neoformans var. grubii]OWZ31167.1 hypothetical protein C347_03927 [Cryptococcus neoformans var. grubii AD2-60a]OWZ43268.1 hypothetical protein C343_03865 [Cryptococcus neoformans var. grubii C23]|eukprot:XP_012049913.1 hypothetical protein CNAG_02060 [Cryptococcus neoformans var. grubii H99]
MSKTLFFVATLAISAVVVHSQAAPNWQYIPQTCASDCTQTLMAAYLCETTYTDGVEVYSCFCNNFPSDATVCASCLNSNDASAMASVLTSAQTACPAAISQCFFECDFPTCNSSDVACQCDGTYLQNIFSCASCNTANGNAGATQIADFQSLQESCVNQNYTGASQNFTTKALPTIATSGYTAPSLTASGGGAAASDTAAVAIGTASNVAGTNSATAAASASAAASSSSSAAASSGGETISSAAAAVASTTSAAQHTSAVSGTTSGSVSRSVSQSASASSSSNSSSSGASMVTPAVGGVLAVAGAVLALL